MADIFLFVIPLYSIIGILLIRRVSLRVVIAKMTQAMRSMTLPVLFGAATFLVCYLAPDSWAIPYKSFIDCFITGAIVVFAVWVMRDDSKN